MPQTYRDYSVFELAISLRDFQLMSNGEDGILEGDIVAVRKPLDGIGLSEGHAFLWLRADGLDANNMTKLSMPLYEPLNDTTGTVRAKRRYCIPLVRLKQIEQRLDLAKSRDVSVIHQPFMPIDTEGPHLFLATSRPFSVHGLVYDKATREYL